ncbi:2-deoxy-D-gluconate 3-dehydrogenase [Novosphingobium sp. PC22D]|uniref:SDR family NAD(P)-dependent oxidoreductase n=1 Tax=Novosphingobium sp. PC22D TaxID=1962403 RepID=UPI000BF1D613|nr:glucose 1-dehydrogenase [Novosphingobium sp. PC22D]PEQ13641.1 2-deoxy-D-gluconate 3-dehydrogenase [Novosphingobium sp. PC22D]
MTAKLLSGKIAIVTGASSGLGEHFARTLAGAGANLALIARREDRLVVLAEELRATGVEVLTVTADLKADGSPERCVAETVAGLGAPDILVNNAGVTRTQPAMDYDGDAFAHLFEINVRAPFEMARHTARQMKGKGGSIINIASILGLRQGGNVTPYAMSKAAILQMTRQLALEWARYGIRVNALAPGYLETELNQAFFASDAGERLIKRIPQRRLGSLNELDGPLLLLASDQSSYMTGSDIVVDGGHLVSTL